MNEGDIKRVAGRLLRSEPIGQYAIMVTVVLQELQRYGGVSSGCQYLDEYHGKGHDMLY